MIRQCRTTRAYAPTGWFFAITLSISSIGCGDGDGGLAPPEPEPELRHVRGVVQSFMSGQPVPDATVEVQVYQVQLVGDHLTSEWKPISSGITNAAGEFELSYWATWDESNCSGVIIMADHDHYDSHFESLCPGPVPEVVIKLPPNTKTLAVVPAAATVSLGGTQVFVSDVLYWDGTQRTGTVEYQWKIYAGPECGTVTAERAAQATYTAPSSMPSGSCDIAPPGHVWIYYSRDFVFWKGQNADITLQP